MMGPPAADGRDVQQPCHPVFSNHPSVPLVGAVLAGHLEDRAPNLVGQREGEVDLARRGLPGRREHVQFLEQRHCRGQLRFDFKDPGLGDSKAVGSGSAGTAVGLGGSGCLSQPGFKEPGGCVRHKTHPLAATLGLELPLENPWPCSK